MLCGDCGVVLWITSMSTSKRYHHTCSVSFTLNVVCLWRDIYSIIDYVTCSTDVLTTELNGRTK